jgi:hypothetical protein
MIGSLCLTIWVLAIAGQKGVELIVILAKIWPHDHLEANFESHELSFRVEVALSRRRETQFHSVKVRENVIKVSVSM